MINNFQLFITTIYINKIFKNIIWYLFAINNYIDTQVIRRGRQYHYNPKKIVEILQHALPIINV